MSKVDSALGSLYYAGTALTANSQAAKKTQEKTQSQKIKKTFSSFVEDKKEENYLISQGLPLEIAGMSIDDAVDFLKDELDMAGDNLGINATPQAFDRYKKAVGQFIKFLEKNNYTIDIHKRKSRRGKTVKPAFQIIAINEQLDKLARDLWYNHLDKFKLLEKVHQINGLVIDLLAA